MKLRSYTKEEVENLIGAIIAEVLDENHDEMLKILDSIPKEFRSQIINTNGVCGETPAHIAIYKDDEYMLQILLDYGAHPHAQNLTKAGDTLLHTATKLGKLGFLTMLYETHLCDMQIRNKESLTLLDVARQNFDPFKDLFALRLFKNYIAFHATTGDDGIDDDVLLSREEYELQQHKLFIRSSLAHLHAEDNESPTRDGETGDLNSLTTGSLADDDHDDDHSSSITFYDNGLLKPGTAGRGEGTNHQMYEYSPRFEIDHHSVHGYDLNNMDTASLNSRSSTGTDNFRIDRSEASKMSQSIDEDYSESSSKAMRKDGTTGLHPNEYDNKSNQTADSKSQRRVRTAATAKDSGFQPPSSSQHRLSDTANSAKTPSERTTRSNPKSAGIRMSQEEAEKISIIQGRKLCEEYILDRIAYDEFMRVENLKKDTMKWMRDREKHRRILGGMDHYHNNHFNSRMTYPQVEGKEMVTQENKDWFDKFRFGVQLVSRSIYVDNVVMNAVKIGTLKAEQTIG